jgi:LPS O-antigen subunit length determinant protein (WzzB/FepE family)
MNKMNKMNRVKDDETDLYEFFYAAWDGKKQISAFVAIAVLLGGIFLSFQKTKYESELFSSVDTTPPFYNDNKVLSDFKKKFFSVSVFKDWEKSKNNTLLKFEEFSSSEVVNGILLTKFEDDQLATIEQYGEGQFIVLIKSNQFSILDEFYQYAEYVNYLMKTEYINRAEEELNIIETRFKDFSTANDAIISQILTIDRYIVSADRGAKVLNVQHPTLPKKTSPHPILTIFLSIIFGGMVGVAYVLFSNVIRKR